MNIGCDTEEGCYLDTIREQLLQAKVTRDKTSIRLENLIQESNPDIIDMSTTLGNSQRVFKLLMTSDVQVFHTIIREGDAIKSHKHKKSAEFFFIVKGTLRVCGKDFKPGCVAEIKKGKLHAPKAINGDCEVIVIAIPPEIIYE